MNEIRAVAPLIVTGPSLQLVGPCTLVTNGTHVVAFSSAELLRAAGEPLAIALSLDGSKSLPVTAWRVSRMPHMGLIDLGTTFPFDEQLDVVPLPLAAICANIHTRGAPSALVTMEARGGTISRRVIPVHVDTIDGGGMSDDVITHLASPDDEGGTSAIEGAPLFSWLPADPLLGRPSEVVAVALGCVYRTQVFRPREHAAIAELFGLEDLGRALPHAVKEASSNVLPQIAGEIRDVDSGPIADDRDREGD